MDSKTARAKKCVYKAELHVALRDAADKQRLAASAEKKAKMREAKVDKYLKRAEQARKEASKARLYANSAAEAAAAAQALVEQKLVYTRDAVTKLSKAEFAEKTARKIALKKKRATLKMSQKPGNAVAN